MTLPLALYGSEHKHQRQRSQYSRIRRRSSTSFSVSVEIPRVAIMFGCPEGSSFPGRMKSTFVPRVSIWLVMSALTPCPMETRRTTEPTPMMIPSIVSVERSQFSRSALIALVVFSARFRISINSVPAPVPLTALNPVVLTENGQTGDSMPIFDLPIEQLERYEGETRGPRISMRTGRLRWKNSITRPHLRN